jgi:hypothetical protein
LVHSDLTIFRLPSMSSASARVNENDRVKDNGDSSRFRKKISMLVNPH